MNEDRNSLTSEQLREYASLSDETVSSAIQNSRDEVIAAQAPRSITSISEDLPTVLKKKVAKHIERHDRPIMRDFSGIPLEARNFPDSGNDLKVEQAIAISGRFRAKMGSNKSSGGAALCFIRHVLYGLGTGSPREIQKDFIATLSTIARRGSAPVARVAEFVSWCEDYELVRTILAGLIRNQQDYFDRISGIVGQNSRIGSARRILAIGYSEAVVAAVVALRMKSPYPFEVVYENVDDDVANLISYEHALKRHDIKVVRQGLSPNNDAIFEVDAIFVSATAVSVSEAKRVSVVSSSPAANLLAHYKSANPNCPVVAVASLFKLLPNLAVADADAAGGVIDEASIDFILSDIGLTQPAQFARNERVSELVEMPNNELFLSSLIIPTLEGRREFNKRVTALVAADIQRDKMPTDDLSEKERASLLSIMEVPDGELPDHFRKGAEEFRRLLRDDRWISSNDGNYVAIKGETVDDIAIGDTVWDVLRVARDSWGIKAPFVAQARKSPSPQ